MEESGAAAECLGPIPQAHFLLGLGIEPRLEALVQRATAEQAEALRTGFRSAAAGSGLAASQLSALLPASLPALAVRSALLGHAIRWQA